MKGILLVQPIVSIRTMQKGTQSGFPSTVREDLRMPRELATSQRPGGIWETEDMGKLGVAVEKSHFTTDSRAIDLLRFAMSESKVDSTPNERRSTVRIKGYP